MRDPEKSDNPVLRLVAQQRRARGDYLNDLRWAYGALHTAVLKAERGIKRHERLERYRRRP